MRSTSSFLDRLLSFGLHHGLVDPLDLHDTRNALLDALGLDAPEAPFVEDPNPPRTATALLQALCAAAVAGGRVDDTPGARALFSTRLMGLLMPKPSTLAREFWRKAEAEGAKAACDWFYGLCYASQYINADALAQDVLYYADSPYGTLEITINLSKPEKDPRDIAALKHAKPRETAYPPCMLCVENEGYAGRLDFPARQTLRALPITLHGEPWRFQYSPYRYFPEHCIVLNERHTPMKLGRDTFEKLFDFLERIPHYCIGSNADLPIVGGSILNHDHFQGGNHRFPMEKAPVEAWYAHPDFQGVSLGVVRWPLTCLRLRGVRREQVAALAEALRLCWNGYDDPAADILSHTGDEPHNTVTPIARRQGGVWELDLVLRNNRTTAEHPLGIFHPHADLHHVKKENIGLIEVMGLFVLPGRLLKELEALRHALTCGLPFTPHAGDDPLAKHDEWIAGLVARHGCNLPPDAAEQVTRDALAAKCARVLEDAGVFKLDAAGRSALARFLARAGLVDGGRP